MSIAQLPLRQFPAVVQSYTRRDTIIYALGIGVGSKPEDALHLRFAYERNLLCLPTFSTALASPAAWMWVPGNPFDARHLVALSHDLQVFSELPVEATVTSQVRVTDVYDRGPGRGALIHWERDLKDADSGRLLSRLRARALARKDGGFGGKAPPPRAAQHIPDRAPDHVELWPTTSAQGLLYRLSGDENPLHVDPAVAEVAGFERPILHGLCSLGIVGFIVIKLICLGDPVRLKRISARYAGVVYPGEMLKIALWQEGRSLVFRCWSGDDDRIVLDDGFAAVD